MSPAMVVTAIAGLVGIVAYVGIDIYWAADHVPGNTLSEVIRFLSRYVALLPLAGGVLGGHFWHLELWSLPRSQGIPLMIWLVFVAIMASFATPTPMFVYFLAGIAVGCICWPV
jgi:hypothetical protein